MNDEKRFAGKALECPLATKDVFENTKNRDWTIENFAYGPLNPDFPDEGFWEEKAELWKTDICRAPAKVMDLANLGYCQLFKFKCAGARTCDAWVHGGPIVDGEEVPDVKGEMGEIIEQLHDASDKHKNQAIRLTSLMEDMNR